MKFDWSTLQPNTPSLRMLFQRLYNWIKYKTLPPSHLFKNRLFIERDSKHRRIFNNFGLTFRNSKWSNYEMYNVKFQFQWTYYKYFFFFIFFFIGSLVFFRFNYLYLSSTVMSSVSFFFWVSVDAFDYYLSFFIWLGVVSGSMLLNTAYSYIFFSTYSDPLPIKEVFSTPFFNQKKLLLSPKLRTPTVSKHVYSNLLYSWLVDSSSIRTTLALESMFDTIPNRDWWNTFYKLFPALYKTAYLCSLSSKKYSVFNIQNLLDTLQNPVNTINYVDLTSILGNSSITNTATPFILQYCCTLSSTPFDYLNDKSNATWSLKTRSEWNLLSTKLLKTQYNHLLRIKSGAFYSPATSLAAFYNLIGQNPELWLLSSGVQNQLEVGKWDRWLYRYSLLHRKVLKNSHKLTITKRLINSGYFSNSQFTQNIWNTVTLNKKIDQRQLVHSSYNLLYPNINQSVPAKSFLSSMLSLTSLTTSNEKLSMISNYESSFFWIMKRVYNFNSLSTNFTTSSLAIKNHHNIENVHLHDEIRKYFQTEMQSNNYLLQNRALTLAPISITLNLTNLIDSVEASTRSEFAITKDTFLLFMDNELLTLDNSRILNDIVSNPLSSGNKISHLSILSNASLGLTNYVRSAQKDLTLNDQDSLYKTSPTLNYVTIFIAENFEKDLRLNEAFYALDLSAFLRLTKRQ